MSLVACVHVRVRLRVSVCTCMRMLTCWEQGWPGVHGVEGLRLPWLHTRQQARELIMGSGEGAGMRVPRQSSGHTAKLDRNPLQP